MLARVFLVDRVRPSFVLVLAAVLLLPGLSRAQNCDTGNPCMAGVCLQDGTCDYVPANEGKSCDTWNQCETNGKCTGGTCKGTVKADGSSCDDYSPCTNNDRCHTTTIFSFSYSYCLGDYKCGEPDLMNPCTYNCNPMTGKCENFDTHLCDDDCRTGTCVPNDDPNDPGGYTCTNVVNKANGTSCDDGNDCRTNDKCQSGECVPGSGSGPTNSPTRSPTSGPATATHTVAPPTATRTHTLPAATATRTHTLPSATPTVRPCTGDCRVLGEVHVDDLLLGVRMLLGQATPNQCVRMDRNGDGVVTIDEVVGAVASATYGCVAGDQPTATLAATITATPPGATATATASSAPNTATHTVAAPTQTRSPTTVPTTPVVVCTPPQCDEGEVLHCPLPPCSLDCGVQCATPTGGVPTDTPEPDTPTDTPEPDTPTNTPIDTPVTPGGGTPGITDRAAGAIVSSTSSFLAIADLIVLPLKAAGALSGLSLKTAGDQGSGAAALPIPPIGCPDGGSVSGSCSPMFGPGKATYALTANNCTMNTASGQTLRLNGSVKVVDQDESHTCLSFQAPTDVTFETTPNFTVERTGTGTTTTAVITIASGSTIRLSGSDPSCSYSNVDLVLSGSIAATTNNGQGQSSSVTVALSNTEFAFFAEHFTDKCVPDIYSLLVNGAATLTTPSKPPLSATYTNYEMLVNEKVGGVSVEVSGQVALACFGKTVTLATAAGGVIDIMSGQPCPNTGEVIVTPEGEGDALVGFTGTGGVRIDRAYDWDTPTWDESYASCTDPQLYNCP